MLTHRKELIQQNAEELRGLWPGAPIGIYSAGLKKRQLGDKITFAGIQSVYKKAHLLGAYSHVIVDEAHSISAKSAGMYIQLFTELHKLHPNFKLIGLTATPYRLDCGILTEGSPRIFTDVSYEIGIKELIDQGYLSPLVSKVSDIKADLSKVGKRGKEYISNQLETVMTEDDLVKRSIQQLLVYGADRKSWLIFCVGIKHVMMVVLELKKAGINAVGVSGETPPDVRAKAIADLKSGAIQALVNCEVFTTGFNVPGIDMLVMLRPTMSTALYVQMCGRGTRLSPVTLKQNCLIIDFANNIEEHGPITDIRIHTNTKQVRKNWLRVNLAKCVKNAILGIRKKPRFALIAVSHFPPAK